VVHGDPLRVLFVGRLVQLKGLSYLFEAMARVGACCTLTLLGSRPEVGCKPLASALQRHTWLAPVPHARVLEIMAQHDVLAFPSLIEGFGAVILEAMSRGMPVITTPNTAGPDLIEEGIDGYIVPIRDADAIAERLTALAEDRSRLAAMADAARRKAAGLPWERYERRLAGLMADCVYERR
jgi:glycosyltransferase involved in cell wall biosynthesis